MSGENCDPVPHDGTEIEKQAKFHVDMDLIPAANLNDDTDQLKALGIDVFNQEDLEQGIHFYNVRCCLCLQGKIVMYYIHVLINY